MKTVIEDKEQKALASKAKNAIIVEPAILAKEAKKLTRMTRADLKKIILSRADEEKASETSKIIFYSDALSNIEAVRRGIAYGSFIEVADKSKITLREWSDILHMSERTMQRYKKESISFEPLQSEKILQIAHIFLKGEEVFGDENKFSQWLSEENLALGGLKPKELLDNVFGIQMIEDELVKIEYGIFA